MPFSSLNRKIKDIPISRKLYFTIGFMALLVTVELCTLWFSVTTLSAVRSYVGGEGLWSKSQKDAVMHLKNYAYTHDSADYNSFQKFLDVPEGDKLARLALENKEPDFEAARKGFLMGRNHPDDIEGMTHLITRFHKVYYLKKAFTAWAMAEPALEKLKGIGKELHLLIQSRGPENEIVLLLREIDHINSDLTKLEDNFSYTLGEGARWLEDLVLKLVLTLSLTIGSISIMITVSVSRNIQRGLNAIINGANEIAKGKYATRVKVYSGDEIGILATSFNSMTAILEHSINQLNQTQEKLTMEKKRAESSEKVKQHFLTNMSHEIRTPMNAVLGFAHQLEHHMKNKIQKESLQLIIKSGDRLLAMLNDILDFSQIVSGQIVFHEEPFQPRKLIDDLCRMMMPEMRLKQLQLHRKIDPQLPDVIIGDSLRFKQILANLMSNAVKFTEQGSIGVHVNLIKETKHSIFLEFIIKDTGIGIPEDKEEVIFNYFENAGNEISRRFGGAGLGLSIVKQLTELQNGTVRVSGKLGEGTEFSIRLPFLKTTKDFGNNKTGTHKQSLHSFSGVGKSVLVVEDNPVNQKLLLKLLDIKGYRTEIAENGRIALNKLENRDYDVVLMDLQMPEMDGYEATMKIRKLSTSVSNVPIIAMTAHTIEGERARCLDLGMNEYISKPFYADELYQKMAILLK